MGRGPQAPRHSHSTEQERGPHVSRVVVILDSSLAQTLLLTNPKVGVSKQVTNTYHNHNVRNSLLTITINHQCNEARFLTVQTLSLTSFCH